MATEYVKKIGSYEPEHIFAGVGDVPVVTDSGTVQAGKTIRKLAPVQKTADGISEIVADTAAPENTFKNFAGLAAEDAEGGKPIVFYLTGEFFASAIPLPADVTAEDLKTACRRMGIFLKTLG